jgi:hypothetical protein
MVSVDAFRIMAPQAVKRTAFKKDGRPDTRAVMNGKAFDVENHALSRTHEMPFSGQKISIKLILSWRNISHIRY